MAGKDIYAATNIMEDYKNWKKNTPYLYDCIVSHGLEWPSLTVQWLPLSAGGSEKKQRLLLGTNTSGAEQDFLMLAEVPFELVRNGKDMEGDEDAIKIVKKMAHQGEINKARYMPQNPEVVATQTAMGEVHIYNTETSAPISKLKSHSKEGYGLSWNEHTAGLLLSSSNDSTICLWNIHSSVPVSVFKVHKGGVQDVAWHSTNPNLFCSVSEDCKAFLWDSRTPDKPSSILEGHEEGLNCIDFNKLADNILAIGSADATISVWDLRNLSYKQSSLEQHDDEVLSLAWAPFNENLLASGDKDGRVMVWNLAKLGEEISKEDAKDGSPELIFTHGGHVSSIADLQWNKEAQLILASVEQENILQIWKMDKAIYEEEETIKVEDIKDEYIE